MSCAADELLQVISELFLRIYATKKTIQYLFQILYHMVFELEDLQHFPVSHLSFVLFTSKKRGNILSKKRVAELFSPAHNHLFSHNELLGELYTRCHFGTRLFQLLQATRGHPFPPLITSSSDHPAPLTDTEISMQHPRRSRNAG